MIGSFFTKIFGTGVILISAVQVSAAQIKLKDGYYGPGYSLNSGFQTSINHATGKIGLEPSQNPLNGYEGGDGLTLRGLFQCDYTGSRCLEIGGQQRTIEILDESRFYVSGELYTFGGTTLQTPSYFFGSSSELRYIPKYSTYRYSSTDLIKDTDFAAQERAFAKCYMYHRTCVKYGETYVRRNYLCDSLYENPTGHQVRYQNVCTVISYVRGTD